MRIQRYCLALVVLVSSSILGIAQVASSAADSHSSGTGPLVHRYSFNDGTANDSVGKANGKLIGAVKIEGGQAQFDGAPDERIELLASGPDGININAFHELTVEAWFTRKDGRGWERIFDFGKSDVSGGRKTGGNYLFYVPHSGFFEDSRAAMSNTANRGGEAVASVPTIPAGVETHVAVVVDAEALTLYINGKKVKQTALTGQSIASLSNQLALLGASLYSDPDFAGSINEFRIYNIAADDQQMQASFQAGPDKIAITTSPVRNSTRSSDSGGPAVLQIDPAHIVARVSPTFAGLMTEEINHSYDGGLYAELLRDRSLAEPLVPQANAIGPWMLVSNGPGKGGMSLDVSDPLSEAIPASLRIDATSASPRDRVGVANKGYWGIPVLPSTRYRASFYAKTVSGSIMPVTVSIESEDGKVQYAHASVKVTGTAWKHYETVLTTAAGGTRTEKARFVISTNRRGTFWVTLASLFPPTWKNRPNGNRVDLMQDLADLHPKFLRLPGGNYLEGNTIATRFDWKKTIGDLRNRAGHEGTWGYRSSDGLGYLEFLEWCEDLGMEPVLGVYAGLSFREPPVKAGPDLEPFVQDALDEIEYTIGGPETKWGAVRSKDGHPAPFKLRYVEVSNEDGGPTYDSRFAQFYDAIKQHYPELQIIATSPVTSRTPDVLDEHFYPGYGGGQGAFFGDVNHYDLYSRKGPKIFVGEWATVDGSPTPTFKDALSDAAWMTGMERNSDIVIMQAYAPLLANVNRGGYEWKTNLIGYDALTSFGSPSYYAQKMFNANVGDVVLESTLASAPGLFTSVTRDTRTGAIYLKAVNSKASPIDVEIKLGGTVPDSSGRLILLTSPDLTAVNTVENPTRVAPIESTLTDIKSSFRHEFPANSISVLVLKTPLTEADHKQTAEEALSAATKPVMPSRPAGKYDPENYDQEHQYKSLLDEYNSGKRDPELVQHLALLAQTLKHPDEAHKFATEYINSLNEDQRYTKDNLQFTAGFTHSSADPGFELFFHHSDHVDQVLGQGISERVVEGVITRQEINAILYPNGKPRAKEDIWQPDWQEITTVITKKYGSSYADRPVSDAKVQWYRLKQQWPQYTESLVYNVNKYGGSGGAVYLNNNAWEVFLHDSRTEELKNAIGWAKRSLELDENNEETMDTLANLQYKSGQREEGLAWEEKALKAATAKNLPEPALKVYRDTLDKMKQGQQTWPNE